MFDSITPRKLLFFLKRESVLTLPLCTRCRLSLLLSQKELDNLVASVFEDYVVRTALYDGNGRYQSDLCFFLQFWNGQRTTVTHGGTNLAQREVYVIFERTCVWNVGVNAFLEGQFLVTAEVVSLPVSCTSRTFARSMRELMT